MIKIKRALLSVSDKQGIVEFARFLHGRGVEILSTGGTAALLEREGIPVTRVSEFTGFPEILDGRVKTINPRVHGAILADRTKQEHIAQLEEHDIPRIDLVVANLYPFEAVVSSEGATLEDAIENIDIGGPAMVRAAAKNYGSVAVITNPARYPEVKKELEDTDAISLETSERLSAEAFQLTAYYDGVISNYLGSAFELNGGFPERLTLAYEKVYELRHGENPNQKAALYRGNARGGSAAGIEQLHGKVLSFNNFLDIESALELVSEFEKPTAVIMKHTNPCGVACGKDLLEAYRGAHTADPISAFGSIIALNREVEQKLAEELVRIFVEVVIAPGYTEGALEVLRQKKNLRILKLPDLAERNHARGERDMKKLKGGLLIQDYGKWGVKKEELEVATRKRPTEEELEAMLFAWKVTCHVKSNAIVLAKKDRTTGIGAGQMSRVDSVWIAARKAGDEVRGSVMASDAFFPFRDSIDAAAEAGITAVIQPGGSIRDGEVIKAADEHGIAMVFTHKRCFTH